MEELQGQIIEFIFQNDVNSYTIAVVETNEGEEITVTGYLPFINVGDTLKMFGKHIIHQEYGEQFKIETFEKLMPQTLDALERYLANGTIKGIGPSIAKRIVTTFGEDTINVFKFEPKKLAQIKGITETRAEEMSKEFVENWELWQIVGFLEKFGINVSSAKKIYKELGTSTIEEIENNPYLLVDIIQNVDFKKIDKMALDLGMSLDNTKRVKSGIKFSLGKISLNGHCCTLKQNLIKYVSDLLGVDIDRIEDAIKELILKEEIEIEKRYEEEWVYLKYFYDAENNIAQKLLTLQNSKNIKKMSNFNKELEKAEKANSIELSEKQKEAIKKVNENNVTVITGGPGTGKTTIINAIVKMYINEEKISGADLLNNIALLAPTGRAAKKLSESVNLPAMTIHRYLKWNQENNTFQVNEDNKNYQKFIIVDETSMIDTHLFAALLNGIYSNIKLIIVGDSNQLPSVGPGLILNDLISSGCFSYVELQDIYRQSSNSYIPDLAKEIKEYNVSNNFLEQKDDYNFINVDNSSIKETVKKICEMSKVKGLNETSIQILAPMYKGENGIDLLNILLQNLFNSKEKDKKEIKVGDVIYREKDKVLQLVNDPDNNVYNGDIGYIHKINKDGHNKDIVTIDFDGNYIEYKKEDMINVKHAYAITIHKAQGSEFNHVIMPISSSYKKMLYNKLIYTGVSRAKKSLVIIGDPKVFVEASKNSYSTTRKTNLSLMIMNNLQD